jgi:hypothetical protein
MFVMLEGRTRPGVTREERAGHLSPRLKAGALDLIRHGAAWNVLRRPLELVAPPALSTTATWPTPAHSVQEVRHAA